MTSLEIKTIFKEFTTVELFYITTNQDGQEVIWKKITEIKNGQERKLQHRFYVGAEFHPELQTSEEIHQYLVDFLHKIEEKQKEDVDPDDNFETVFTFTDDPEPKEPETYAVWEGHMDKLRKKVATIKNKCRKFGCDFTFEEVGEEIRDVPSLEINPLTKKPVLVKCRFILVKAQGTAVINDWEFIASVEHTSAGNIFSKAMTDIQIPARYRTTDSCTCEHCNTKRIRKNTCIIRNTKTGEFKQVGNSCLNDFTHGMSASFAVWCASLKTIFKEAEDEPIYHDRMGWWEKYYSTKEILQYTAETIRHFGYTKTENRGDSTRDKMERFFNFTHGNTKYWEDSFIEETRNLMQSVGFDPESPEAVKMTEDALAWIADQEATNDYMHNLKVATSLKDTNSSRFGILVSLFPTYNRDLEIQAKRKAEAEAGKMSKHVGQVGDRIDVQVQSIKCLTSWTSSFDGWHESTTYIWKITGTDGNIYTWKTSKWMNEEIPPVSIKGTVKEHKEYLGVLQTELTRCKVTRKTA